MFWSCLGVNNGAACKIYNRIQEGAAVPSASGSVLSSQRCLIISQEDQPSSMMVSPTGLAVTFRLDFDCRDPRLTETDLVATRAPLPPAAVGRPTPKRVCISFALRVRGGGGGGVGSGTDSLFSGGSSGVGLDIFSSRSASSSSCASSSDWCIGADDSRVRVLLAIRVGP